LARLAETDPEAGLLGRIYQRLDVRPAGYWSEDVPAAAAADLAILHAAIRANQPVAFGYTDPDGNQTTRTVLPLALVHTPQGVELLAWCTERQDFRQFFVRAIQGPAPQHGDFSHDRMTLLEGLLDKYSSRA
jgi:predicted DNA-binding transcriptional regulator YafY